MKDRGAQIQSAILENHKSGKGTNNDNYNMFIKIAWNACTKATCVMLT